MNKRKRVLALLVMFSMVFAMVSAVLGTTPVMAVNGSGEITRVEWLSALTEAGEILKSIGLSTNDIYNVDNGNGSGNESDAGNGSNISGDAENGSGDNAGTAASAYCEINAVPVEESLKSFTSRGLIFNASDNTQNELVDCEVEFGDILVKDSDEEGFNEIIVNFTTLLYTDASTNRTAFYTPMLGWYDYYTGLCLNAEDAVLDGNAGEGMQYEKTIEFNGKSYKISSRIDLENTFPGVTVGGGSVKQQCQGNWTLTVKMPKDYDGLLLGFIPLTGIPMDTETEAGEAYILDEYVEGTYMFRIMP